MKIAICEDDEKQREEIKKICDNYFAGINQAYEYNEYAEGETLLKDERKEIDLLFLDIDLGSSMDGIAVMNELEKSSSVKKYCLFPVIIRQSGIRSDVRAGRLLKKDVVHTKEIENEMGS